jgi:hypothetical protein
MRVKPSAFQVRSVRSVAAFTEATSPGAVRDFPCGRGVAVLRGKLRRGKFAADVIAVCPHTFSP